MTLMKHLEWKLNSKLKNTKWRRERERERLRRVLPQRTRSWKRRGFAVQAFVVRSRLGRMDVCYRLGTMQFVRGEPAFSPRFEAHGAGDLLELLESAKTWHELGGYFDAEPKVLARNWKRVCGAMQKPSVVDCSSTKKIDRVACLVFKTRSHFGPVRHTYQLIVPSEKHRNSEECEHFFTLFDFMAVEDLLREIRDKHVAENSQAQKPS